MEQIQEWKAILGETLHTLRRRKRLSLRALAKKVSINYTDLSKLERGERPQIIFEAIFKLAKFHEVSMDGLLGNPQWTRGHNEEQI